MEKIIFIVYCKTKEEINAVLKKQKMKDICGILVKNLLNIYLMTINT